MDTLYPLFPDRSPVPCPVQPDRAMPFLTRPHPAMPDQAACNQVGSTAPRLFPVSSSSSQTRCRQSGGMIPSRSAWLIMPRCRISARRTWHRRHNTRKLLSAFDPRFPDLMWSMWARSTASDHAAKSRQYGPWQRPWSRCQTRPRVTRHTARGCRHLGIVRSVFCQITPICSHIR